MAKTFLGRGLSFPVQLASDGDMQTADYEASVRQAIALILSTAKGERVMRPEFGCGIYDLVFELNSATTASKISQEVQDALLKFEPRIDVLAVEVTAASDSDGEKLLIEVRYRVRTTNNAFNLVYPFFLERSAG